MAYSILPAEPVSDAVQRISLDQLDRAVAAIEDRSLARTEAVYVLRKRCKKVRALLRLARGPLDDLGLYRPANEALRDIAGAFSGLRDADVMLASYDRAMADVAAQGTGGADRRAFGPIRAKLTGRRRALQAGEETDRESGLAAQLDEAHWLLLKLRLGVADWTFADDGFAAVEPGLRKTYGRVLSAAKAARRDASIEALHEWRKRVKYHRNHLRLLKKLAPQTLGPRIEALWTLGDLLGLDHDLAVVHQLVRHDPVFAPVQARRRFLEIVARRRDAVQKRALAAADEAGFPSEDETLSRLAGLWNIGMNRPVAAGRLAG